MKSAKSAIGGAVAMDLDSLPMAEDLPPSRKGKKSFVVWMDPELHFTLKDIAHHVGKPINELVIEGIGHVISKHERKVKR